MPHDELAEKRRRREMEREDEEGQEEDLPKFSGLDILAMIIAAYQVLLPILGAFIGVMILVYLLFRFAFS